MSFVIPQEDIKGTLRTSFKYARNMPNEPYNTFCDLRSHNIAKDKNQELLCLFPEIRTEDGKIAFERLKLALDETVDEKKR